MPRPKGQSLLTRERILDAALEIIDRDGLEALSMRKLGTQLGVDPMSIYHHIPNKETLLRSLIEQLFASIPVPSKTGGWKRRVREWAVAYRGVATAHPNLVLRIVSDAATVAVAAVHANESLYSALEASQLPPKSVVRAADVIVDYVNGSALALLSPSAHETDAVAALQAELDARPREQTAVQRRLLSDPTILTGRDSFEFGLDVILAGLDQLAKKRPPSQSPT